MFKNKSESQMHAVTSFWTDAPHWPRRDAEHGFLLASRLRDGIKPSDRLTSLTSLLILRAFIKARLSSEVRLWKCDEPFILFKSFLYFSCEEKQRKQSFFFLSFLKAVVSANLPNTHRAPKSISTDPNFVFCDTTFKNPHPKPT